MDAELVLWILFFVGGYLLILGYFLRIALGRKEEKESDPPSAPPPE